MTANVIIANEIVQEKVILMVVTFGIKFRLRTSRLCLLGRLLHAERLPLTKLLLVLL